MLLVLVVVGVVPVTLMIYLVMSEGRLHSAHHSVCQHGSENRDISDIVS